MQEFSSNSLHSHFTKIMHLYFSKTYPLLEKIGIHPGQVPLLATLKNKNGLSQRELRDYLLIKPSTIAVMIQRMEKTELVERKQDEKDQRISRIFITEHGNAVLEQVIIVINKIEQDAFFNFTQEEQMLMKRLFLQMQNNLMATSDNQHHCCLNARKDGHICSN